MNFTAGIWTRAFLLWTHGIYKTIAEFGMPSANGQRQRLCGNVCNNIITSIMNYLRFSIKCIFFTLSFDTLSTWYGLPTELIKYRYCYCLLLNTFIVNLMPGISPFSHLLCQLVIHANCCIPLYELYLLIWKHINIQLIHISAIAFSVAELFLCLCHQ